MNPPIFSSCTSWVKSIYGCADKFEEEFPEREARRQSQIQAAKKMASEDRASQKDSSGDRNGADQHG
jgi:hypothetical protein